MSLSSLRRTLSTEHGPLCYLRVVNPETPHVPAQREGRYGHHALTLLHLCQPEHLCEDSPHILLRLPVGLLIVANRRTEQDARVVTRQRLPRHAVHELARCLFHPVTPTRIQHVREPDTLLGLRIIEAMIRAWVLEQRYVVASRTDAIYIGVAGANRGPVVARAMEEAHGHWDELVIVDERRPATGGVEGQVGGKVPSLGRQSA